MSPWSLNDQPLNTPNEEDFEMEKTWHSPIGYTREVPRFQGRCSCNSLQHLETVVVTESDGSVSLYRCENCGRTWTLVLEG